MENTSGQGSASVVPQEVKGWCWGGFLLTWIWGIGNSTWISLLALVLGPIMGIVLGIKGREWAWQNKQWRDVEHFNAVQKKWSFWGFMLIIASFVLIAILGIIMAIAIPQMAANSGGV